MLKVFQASCQTDGCTGNAFLPMPTNLQSFEVQPYSPTGTWPLLFACPLCRHASTLMPEYFSEEDRPDLDPTNPACEAMWFATVQCSENNCALLLRLHTIAAADSALDDVLRTIYPAIREFRCEANHMLNNRPPFHIRVIQPPMLVQE